VGTVSRKNFKTLDHDSPSKENEFLRNMRLSSRSPHHELSSLNRRTENRCRPKGKSIIKLSSELEVLKSEDGAKKPELFIEVGEDNLQLQNLEETVANLAVKLASVSLKVDSLNRESMLYKMILFEIENVVIHAEDPSVFSSLRITNCELTA